jgi:hypothetical protein
MNARPNSFLYVIMTFTILQIIVVVVVNVFDEDCTCLLKLYEINNLLPVLLKL